MLEQFFNLQTISIMWLHGCQNVRQKLFVNLVLVLYHNYNLILEKQTCSYTRLFLDVLMLLFHFYLLQDLRTQKITPNLYVFNSLMNVNARDLSYTLQIYKHMQVMLFFSLLYVCDIQISKSTLARINIHTPLCCSSSRLGVQFLLKLVVFMFLFASSFFHN